MSLPPGKIARAQKPFVFQLFCILCKLFSKSGENRFAKGEAEEKIWRKGLGATLGATVIFEWEEGLISSHFQGGMRVTPPHQFGV
jgi:hypothetical protein